MFYTKVTVVCSRSVHWCFYYLHRLHRTIFLAVIPNIFRIYFAPIVLFMKKVWDSSIFHFQQLYPTHISDFKRKFFYRHYVLQLKFLGQMNKLPCYKVTGKLIEAKSCHLTYAKSSYVRRIFIINLSSLVRYSRRLETGMDIKFSAIWKFEVWFETTHTS